MKKKLFLRLLCASLAVLMMVCILPALPVSAAADTPVIDPKVDYTSILYDTEADRLASMQKFYDNGEYALYCDTLLGVVAYQKLSTGETLFTNPWDMGAEKNKDNVVRSELMSQIMLEYLDSENQALSLNSYTDAALSGQIAVKNIKNGLRVEYAIGQRSSRILCPVRIEKSAFEEKILKPLQAAVKKKQLTERELTQFKVYFSLQAYTTASENKKKAIALSFPICEKKNIDIYVLNPNTSNNEMRKLEAKIMAYCTDYSFEEMDNDHSFVEYEEEATSPPVFKMALEYTVSGNGLQVSLPANGLRYDETAYRIIDFQVLPFMGASLKTNEGYSFIPDGSGTLYELSAQTVTAFRVYGEDYSLFSNISGYRNAAMRAPVFGQVETVFTPDLISPSEYDEQGNKIKDAEYSETEGTTSKRGFVAIIEEGESLATIAPNHTSYMNYVSVSASFITRQNDTSKSKWKVYANRRYVGDYKLRYILLSDDDKAREASLSDYYECSWMGMACAYRDYVEAKNESFRRLTDEKVGSSLPLYIETFGCMDTVKKVLSMPVTVSVALTSFEDIAKMYDYLAGEGISNVNFKMKGYANGGIYSDVPYKLKWESSVGGKSGFKDLVKYAEEKGFGIFPDFDFVYTTQGDGGNAVKMKKNAARTIDNRYTAKRVYSATQQGLVNYFQMVLAPSTYSKFYEKLSKKYAKFNVGNISLSTFGSELNADYDESKTTLREETKEYVIQALSFFKEQNYDVMLDGGNAYTWNYADHILKVPLDSSRYNAEYRSVPFLGVVLHGYVQFAGDALNMEGNLSYAMLKAMENGASIYFILSYANTEILKEDELLSQNYSVRYDIWQAKLVEIYKELNAVLGDVQTKLIIDHQFLEGSRVPEQKELLLDIADKMAEKQKELEEKIEADRLEAIRLIRTSSDAAAAGAANMISLCDRLSAQIAILQETRFATESSTTKWLLRAWESYRAEAAKPDDDPTKNLEIAVDDLRKQISSSVASPMVQIAVVLRSAGEDLTAAKVGYDTLVACNADAQVVSEARTNLLLALDGFAALYGKYYGTIGSFTDATKEAYVNGTDTSVTALLQELVLASTGTPVASEDLEAFLFGNDAAVEATYAGISAKNLERAFVDMLIRDGLYDEADRENSLIDYESVYQERLSALTRPEDPEPEPEPGEEEPGENEDVVIPDPPKSKYSIDNALVKVTYGEKNAPYKSLILNFNDYAVQTTVDGVTYTIAAYGYVVLYHTAN